MNTNQGKFDSIAGAHDDVQVQATAGNQSSQVANIENETGAQNDARAGSHHQGTSLHRWQKLRMMQEPKMVSRVRRHYQGTILHRWQKIQNNAGAQDALQDDSTRGTHLHKPHS